jgi:hypothetical protein
MRESLWWLLNAISALRFHAEAGQIRLAFRISEPTSSIT